MSDFGFAAAQEAYDSLEPPQGHRLCNEIIDDPSIRNATKAEKGKRRVVRDVELLAEEGVRDSVVLDLSLSIQVESLCNRPNDCQQDVIDAIMQFAEAWREELEKP